jgi:hypothetical protein
MTASAYTCPVCASPASIRESFIIYGRNYGLALICERFPACDTFVGCHQESGLPKGTMANAELRDMRKRAHAAFDPMWKSGEQSRHWAYHWLATKLGLPMQKCHIGMFDVATCRRVVEVVKTYERPMS